MFAFDRLARVASRFDRAWKGCHWLRSCPGSGSAAGEGAHSTRPRNAAYALVIGLVALFWLFDTTPARAEATPDGSFTTRVTVEVPPFHGIEPGIALHYDSRRGNGLVGVGWRLEAASYIARAGRHGGAPRFDDTDVFMLDGERLVDCAPSCSTGGTHETRRRDFTRVSYDGTGWARWRPDGIKLLYEPLPLSTAKGAYRWALSTVTDTHGNTVKYNHDCDGTDGTECYLTSIAYADGPRRCWTRPRWGEVCLSGAEGARVRFYYEARHDPVSYGNGGQLAVTFKRLKTIEVRMAGALVRAYALAYETSMSTGSSLLRSAQIFPSDAAIEADGTVSAGGTKPQPPTVFHTTAGTSAQLSSQQLPTAGLSSLPGASPVDPYAHVFDDITIPNRAGQRYDPVAGEVVRLSSGSLLGDFDGDRRTDVAFWSLTSCSSDRIHITTVLAGRPQSPVETGPEPNPLNAPPCQLKMSGFVADVDGDGLDDAVFMGRLGTLQQTLANGDGAFSFSATTTPTGFSPPTAVGPNRPRCRTGDVNADRRTDLVCLYSSGGTSYVGTARSRQAGGFDVATTALPAAWPPLGQLEMALGDVDANGTADVVIARKVHPTWQVSVGSVDNAGVVHLPIVEDLGWSTGLDSHVWDLSMADVDGDGRADLTLTRTEYQGPTRQTDVVFVATAPKTKNASRTFTPASGIPLNATFTTVADADGDGRADLLTGAPVGEARAIGDGRFANWTRSAPAADDTCGGASSIFVPGEGIIPDHWVAAEPGQPYSAVDVNGDGRGDRLCLGDVDADEFTVHDVISPNRPADLHRWMPADVTGTGRQDLVYVQFRNPGYEVYTLTRRPSGQFTRSSDTISPQPGMSLTNPNAGAWMPVDVGSPEPGGRPDGKTDLVLVDRDGTTLRVFTLLSTGTGWTAKTSAPWPVAYGSADVQNWRPANLNRDGRSDLAHVVPASPGVRVEYLLSNGDGTWSSGSTPSFFATAAGSVPALTARNVQDFHSTDVDGDWVTDLVFVDTGSGDTHIRALLGNGDASFQPRAFSDPARFTAAQARAFQPMDFNGDGMQDLGLIRVGAGCLWVQAFVSTGTDWMIDEAPTVAGCRPDTSVEDLNNVRLVDIDHDNRTDVLHLSRYIDGVTPKTAVHLVLNRGGQRWPVIDPPPLALRYPDTWAYASMDMDLDGRAELVHVDGTELAVLRLDTGSDLLDEIGNGRGASTRIGYRSLVGGRSYLPSGSLPSVVDQVTIRDAAHHPTVEETTGWTYDGARWSDQEGELLGFEEIHSTQGESVVAARYELTDACGARLAATSVENTQGKVFASKHSSFVDPGAGPAFTCLPKQLVDRDCEGQSVCSTKTTTLTHDVYGNLTNQTEVGAQAGTRNTTTDFRPNTGDYIVDRPARQVVSTPLIIPLLWRWPVAVDWPLKAREYLYDTNNAWDSPPGAKGELRRTRDSAWDSREIRGDRYVETAIDYDPHGNPTKTTGPTGVVEQTFYDPERSVFPVKTCNPVGCGEQTWSVKYGAPETTTDLNGLTTTVGYDAYGRQTKVTYPDGGTISTSYPDEGVWQGPDSQRQRVRTEVSDDSSGDGVLWQEQLVDGLGRVYKTIREGDRSGPIVTQTNFADASERPASTIDAHVDCCGARTEYRYDGAHRPSATILPDGATTTTEYRAGATLVRDPVGRTSTAVRDEFGRIIRVEQVDRDPCAGCPATTVTTKYHYDALDRRTRITDPQGNVTTTVWDSLGRKVSEHDPDRGQRSWRWRDDGTLSTATDAKGQVTRWFYDDAGRVIRRTEHADAGRIVPERTIRWSWDRDPTTGETHGYSLGRIVRVEHTAPVVSGATESWYDRMGRTERTRECADAQCVEMGFGFDKAGRLATLTYPDAQGTVSKKSEQLTQRYDSAGRLASLIGHDPTMFNPDTPYATELSYDPLGQLTRLKHSNGLVESRSYDDADPARHWLDSIQVTRPATDVPLYSAEYGHYPDGRIRTVTENQPVPLKQEYKYDDLQRLTQVIASKPDRGRAYSYDTLGRITSSTTAGTYSYGDSAHVHAPTSTSQGHTRSYDTNGNVRTLHDPNGRDLAIEWTVSDMPERIGSGTGGTGTIIGYDADDQRIVRHDSQGTTYYFDRYVEQDPDGRLVRYYWAGGRLVARRTGAGTLTDFHQDRLDSTRLLTDPKGSLVERFDYEPFGTPTTPPTGDERLWHGKRLDHDSSLIYMNARYYDPELGRFASPDSIIPDPYGPQSLDRYAYVENDPTNHTDPSGHMKMQVELRKDQAAQFPFRTSWYRFDETRCAMWGQCPFGTLDLLEHTPGRDKPSNPPLISADDPATPGDQASDPSEWAQWPGEAAPSDPSEEWAEWQSPPPLVAAPPTRVQTADFSEEEGTVIAVESTDDRLRDELRDNQYSQRRLAAEMKVTRPEAISNMLSAAPYVGNYVAAIYDLVNGRPLGTADNLGQEGLVYSIEKVVEAYGGAVLPEEWTAPYDAWKWHKSWMEHGGKAQKMRSLELDEYRLRVLLQDPAARFDLPYDRYMGPGGKVYDQRTKQPHKRIQD